MAGINLRTQGCAAMVLLVSCGPLQAADAPQASPAGQESDEPVGVRFTPNMARGIARKVKPYLKHCELPPDKEEEAEEKIARRLMEAAHAMDGKAQELVMRWMEEKMAADMAGKDNGGFTPPGFGKEFADRVLEITPAMKDLMRNFVQDIRPMLPMKSQLKMVGEMMAAKAGIDTFEQTMRKWSSGEIKESDNPFQGERTIKKDEKGQSEVLRGARKTSQNQLEKFALAEWDRYVKQFKEFYALDEAQRSTVDSILREFKERAEQRKRDASWRERYYRNRLWLNMFDHMPNSFYHPVQMLIKDDQEEATSWLDALGAEFKARLDLVPTAAQRQQADARIESLLTRKGIVLERGKQ